MAKVALVTHDAQTVKNGQAGGVGAFVTHFARLLQQHGEDVTIILTRQETFAVTVDAAWRERYAAWGIGLIEVHNTERSAEDWCEPWTVRLSQQVTPLLAEFDIAYFQDWANTGFDIARRKRFSEERLPVLVTVLHGPSAWISVGEQRLPEVPDDLQLGYVERYAARHSDFVVAPSRYIAGWASGQGWEFAREPEVLGLPFVTEDVAKSATRVEAMRRIVFFGRVETRKGTTLFAEALRLLARESPEVLREVKEIVLLGQQKEAKAVAAVRGGLAEVGVPVVFLGDLDSEGAREYLTRHAGDTLAVVPSAAENFPYAVIEASRVPGLNLLCSNGGGVSEIFDGGAGEDLFEPHPAALAAKIAERLRSPLQPDAQPSYDAAAANERWMSFHRRALAAERVGGVGHVSASVDVCIPHYNHSAKLAGLLEALRHQTCGEFGVIVVDDGSRPEERAAFDAMAKSYEVHGWRFVTQENGFVDAARNRAASLSEAELLLFVDADDVLAPHAIETLRRAMLRSGLDALVAGAVLFEGDGLPYDVATGEVRTRAVARYRPLGPDLVCALADPVVLGTSMILVRRAAFEAVGGYRAVRGAAHEDWELQIRLVMAGFEVDVFPEDLLYFRKSAGGLSQTSSSYSAMHRLLETYEGALAPAGMRGMATAFVSLLRRNEELERTLRESRDAQAQRLHGLVEEMLQRRKAKA